MARIVSFYQTGGPEVLKIEQVELPRPRPGLPSPDAGNYKF
jgi:hypothetical protein